ncbi:MAG: hypothetical protein WCR87_08855 [Saccharofermentanales bacterium]
MKKYISIDDFIKEYEQSPESYNMLVPVQSIQEIPMIYKPIINLVLLSTDLKESHIYEQKNAGPEYKGTRYSITRRGLLLIAAAADCHLLDTQTSYDAEQKAYTSVAKIKVHDPSGGWRVYSASKTSAAEKSTRKGTTYRDDNAAEKAESGAQNRAIRAAFNIKGHYSIEELEMPFVAIYPILNDAEPDVREALIKGAVMGSNLLFGSANKAKELGKGAEE